MSEWTCHVVWKRSRVLVKNGFGGTKEKIEPAAGVTDVEFGTERNLSIYVAEV